MLFRDNLQHWSGARQLMVQFTSNERMSNDAPMWVWVWDRPPHRGWRPVRFTKTVWGLKHTTEFITCQARLVRRVYGLSSFSEKKWKFNRLQMLLQKQHFLLSYFKILSGFEPTVCLSADRCLSYWANQAALYLKKKNVFYTRIRINLDHWSSFHLQSDHIGKDHVFSLLHLHEEVSIVFRL